MNDDVYMVVIIGLVLIAVACTLLGWHHEAVYLRRFEAGRCPACGHPEHWPWCKVIVCPESRKPCWCDFFTQPAGEDELA